MNRWPGATNLLTTERISRHSRERGRSLTLLTHDLPERGFSEENQQVAMKRDEPTSPFIHFLFAICGVNP